MLENTIILNLNTQIILDFELNKKSIYYSWF